MEMPSGSSREKIIDQTLQQPFVEKYWTSFKVVKGKVVCKELHRDISYLHKRGYIFDTVTEGIYTTKRAELLWDSLSQP